MLTLTSLKHPTIAQKLKRAVWLAKLEAFAMLKKQGYPQRAKQYVANRKGNNILRIDWHTTTGLTAYGDCSVNITHTIKQALQESK